MSDTVTQVDTASGNTRNRSRGWCFTLNNYEESDIDLLTQLWDDVRYVFQEETGEEGTPHLQGVVYFENARSFESMKQIDTRIHWERCRSLKKSIDYCNKSETRTGRVFSKGIKLNIVKDPMEEVKLHDWQKDIIDLIKGEPDTRKIYWY